MLEDIVVMGKVIGSFGIKGWLNVYSFTEKIETLEKYNYWYISNDEKNWEKIKIDHCKISDNKIKVKFFGFNNRTKADNYKSYLIGIPKNLLPKLGPDEFYWNDLLGFEVINLKKNKLGKVDYFIETGANDVLVVKGNRERLIPYTVNTIQKIDVKQQKIIVDWDEDF